MNVFWGSFFTELKSCGRSAALFMVTIAGLFIAILLFAIVCEANLQDYVLRGLPVAGCFAAVWGAAAIRRTRRRRHERLCHPRLSADELRKARFRLVQGQRQRG